MARGRRATIRSNVDALQARLERLRIESRSRAAWKHLQYDAVAALVENQRTYVELQSAMLQAMRHDVPLYSRLRMESLDAVSALERHHQLIRTIEHAMHACEHDRHDAAGNEW